MPPNMLSNIEQRFDDLRRELMGRWNEPALTSGLMGSPTCDVIDRGNEYAVTLDVPGFDKKDIHVDVEERGLRVWGSARRESEKREQGAWIRRERTSEAFERYVSLPDEVSADGTRASYKNGVLEVTLPKTAPERRRAKSVEIS